MALNSEQQVRLTIYSFLIFIVVVAGYFVMQIINQANTLSTATETNAQKNQNDYEIAETSVLQTQKFKELAEVVIPAGVATSSPELTPGQELTPAQLSSLPRNPNPFSPSF